MTTLEKLKTLNDLEIQNWLRKVSKGGATTLLYALLGADDEIKRLVFQNMSARAVHALKSDLVKYQKMHLSDTIIKTNSMKLEKLL